MSPARAVTGGLPGRAFEHDLAASAAATARAAPTSGKSTAPAAILTGAATVATCCISSADTRRKSGTYCRAKTRSMAVSPPVASCSSSLAALVGCTRVVRFVRPLRQRGEQAADEVGVVGEERPQLLDGQHERHRRAARPVRLRHRQPCHRFDEPQRRRRVDGGRRRVACRRGHASVEQDVDARRHRILPAPGRSRPRAAPAATRSPCGTARRPTPTRRAAGAAGARPAPRPAAARATARAGARPACAARPAPTTRPRTRTSPCTSRCASTCSTSSARLHIFCARTTSIAAAAVTGSSSLMSCSSVSSTSRGRVLRSVLPRRTRSSRGMSSSTGRTCLRSGLERMLSRYSDAPERPRESPCSSVHRAASMSTGG